MTLWGLRQQCLRAWLSGAPQAARPANFSPSPRGCVEATAAFGNGKDCAPSRKEEALTARPWQVAHTVRR